MAAYIEMLNDESLNDEDIQILADTRWNADLDLEDDILQADEVDVIMRDLM